jgi:hypothetical protein
MITDYVTASDGARSGFVQWLAEERAENLESWLNERKNYKEVRFPPFVLLLCFG